MRPTTIAENLLSGLARNRSTHHIIGHEARPTRCGHLFSESLLGVTNTMNQVIEAGWRNAFNVMKTNYSLTDDAIGVFAINLRFNLDDIQTIVSEAITGGGDDKKCDVLYVDKEREIAVIAQCYISQKPRDAAPANKASDLNTALTWLLSTNLDNLPDVLKGRADELRSAINAGEIKQFYIWYVHNLPCSTNVQDELRAVEDTARAALTRYPSGQDINLFAEEISEEQLDRLYMQAERTVIVTDEITTIVPDAIEIKEGPGGRHERWRRAADRGDRAGEACV
jgi:hypothetical protein